MAGGVQAQAQLLKCVIVQVQIHVAWLCWVCNMLLCHTQHYTRNQNENRLGCLISPQLRLDILMIVQVFIFSKEIIFFQENTCQFLLMCTRRQDHF